MFSKELENLIEATTNIAGTLISVLVYYKFIRY